ncbi:hypothetical protein [Dactylosporangium fulvum]|uniref:Uncharacterized protein n=1 Tax=Dactylosporangium fulvum TaxID=53359 RepID=A0ABY5WDD6_9ACTN|nr:hypothetical protein [Dactylosporangium fulvum]UWP86306.1 hypothetical protein Dfulv_19530 [Dactylosporangium fulvum]
MNRRVVGAAAVVAAGAGAGVAIGRAVRGPDGRVRTDRWHCVTINRAPQDLGAKPPPLDELPFPVDIQIRPAPAGRGTELAVRLARPGSRDAVRRLRRSLREARAIAEVGEVLLPDAPGTARPTVTSKPLAYATRHGREEGRL